MIFWTKFSQKDISGQKLKKPTSSLNSAYSNGLGTKFQLKLTILIFLTRFAQKGFSGLTQKKWTPHIFYIILHVQISLLQNFSSNWQFLSFGPNLPKKLCPIEKRKSKHRHGILHIWISLGTIFQLKLIILNFWIKFTQQKVFPVKAVQRLQVFAFCVVNVNSTVVFKYFDDLKDFFFFFNILKENLVTPCLLGSFYLKIF